MLASTKSDESTVHDDNSEIWNARTDKGTEWTEIALEESVGSDQSDKPSLGTLTLKRFAPVSGLFSCCQGRGKEEEDQPGTDLFNPTAEPDLSKEFKRDPRVDAFVGGWIAQLPKKQEEMESTKQQLCANTVLTSAQLDFVAIWERSYEYWKSNEVVNQWCAVDFVIVAETAQNHSHSNYKLAYRELHKKIRASLRSFTSSQSIQTILNRDSGPDRLLTSKKTLHNPIYVNERRQLSKQIASYLNPIRLEFQRIFQKLREEADKVWCCGQCLALKLNWWIRMKEIGAFVGGVKSFWSDVVVALEEAEEVVGANGGVESESLDRLKNLVMNVREGGLEAQQAISELLKRVDEESRSVAKEVGLLEVDITTDMTSYVELLLGSEWARVEAESEDDLEGKASNRLSTYQE